MATRARCAASCGARRGLFRFSPPRRGRKRTLSAQAPLWQGAGAVRFPHPPHTPCANGNVTVKARLSGRLGHVRFLREFLCKSPRSPDTVAREMRTRQTRDVAGVRCSSSLGLDASSVLPIVKEFAHLQGFSGPEVIDIQSGKL